MARSSEPFDVDAVVVGAGAVGLACAYALAQRGLSVVVLEKERAIGTGISSRNSEVIHAGLYYPPGSLKARLCREGKAAVEEFATQHDIPFEHCGKLVVALETVISPGAARSVGQTVPPGRLIGLAGRASGPKELTHELHDPVAPGGSPGPVHKLASERRVPSG